MEEIGVTRRRWFILECVLIFFLDSNKSMINKNLSFDLKGRVELLKDKLDNNLLIIFIKSKVLY